MRYEFDTILKCEKKSPLGGKGGSYTQNPLRTGTKKLQF